MFFKRQYAWLGSVSTDREPSRSNLYCALSRIIYASAVGGIYLEAYSRQGIKGTGLRPHRANHRINS
ncbi:hypothetical protein QUB68_22855 [Microcoleus sp. A006_D1]